MSGRPSGEPMSGGSDKRYGTYALGQRALRASLLEDQHTPHGTVRRGLQLVEVDAARDVLAELVPSVPMRGFGAGRVVSFVSIPQIEVPKQAPGHVEDAYPDQNVWHISTSMIQVDAGLDESAQLPHRACAQSTIVEADVLAALKRIGVENAKVYCIVQRLLELLQIPISCARGTMRKGGQELIPMDLAYLTQSQKWILGVQEPEDCPNTGPWIVRVLEVLLAGQEALEEERGHKRVLAFIVVLAKNLLHDAEFVQNRTELEDSLLAITAQLTQDASSRVRLDVSDELIAGLEEARSSDVREKPNR